MKKIVLICTALVVALGALGVGYAMWYDQIQVVGNVNTGCVNAGTWTVKSTYAYKSLKTGLTGVEGAVAQVPVGGGAANTIFNAGEPFFTEIATPLDGTPAAGADLRDPSDNSIITAKYVGGIKASMASTTKTITLDFDKAFPTYERNGPAYQLAAVITYKYDGGCNIPVHLDIRNMKDPCGVLLVQTGKNPAYPDSPNTDVIRTEWSVKDDSNTAVQIKDKDDVYRDIVKRSWRDLQQTNPLEGVQLHQDYTVTIKIYLDSDALQAADRYEAGKSVQSLQSTDNTKDTYCAFSFDLIVHQWNEKFTDDSIVPKIKPISSP